MGEGSDREEESGIIVTGHVSRVSFWRVAICKLLKKKAGVLRIRER